MKLSIAISLLFFTQLGHANGFKSCNDYFKRNQMMGSAGLNYGRPPDFSFDDEGKLSVSSDANLKVVDGKEIIEVRTVDYSAIPFTGLKPDMILPTKVVRNEILRDSKGRVVSIRFDQNLNQTEIDRKVNQVKQYREEAKKNGAILLGNEDQIPFQEVVSSEAQFIYNEKGECVPSKSKFSMLIEPKVDGMRIDQTLFDTKLCHDVNKFFKEHPETRACYDKSLNEKMARVFASFVPQETRTRMNSLGLGGDGGGGYGYPGLGGPGYYGGMYGVMGSMGVEGKVIQAASNFTSPSFKTSPVLTGADILESCKMMGLEPFYSNEDNFKVSSSLIQSKPDPLPTEEK